MAEIIVDKEVVDVICELGLEYRAKLEDVGLTKVAEATLARFSNGGWNSSYRKFIQDHLTEIYDISIGATAKYKTATIYRNAETGAMTIEEEV